MWIYGCASAHAGPYMWQLPSRAFTFMSGAIPFRHLSPDDVCLFLLAQTQCSSCHLPKRRRTISTHGDCGGFYLSPQTRIRSVAEYSPHRIYSISWGRVLHDQACRSIIPQLAWYSGLKIFIKMQHFSPVLLPWTKHFPGYASFIGIC